MRVVAIFAGLVGLALSACGEPEPAGGAVPPPSNVATVPSSVAPPTTTATDVVGSNGPYDPDATMRPDLMVVEPVVVGYGDDVRVTYPGGRERGVAYVLESSREGSWHTTHLMTAASDSPDRTGIEPTWADFGTLGHGWEDIGISGPGPDALVIPPSALAGDYRICTANSVENICAEITVVKPDEPMPSGPEPPFGAGTAEPVTGLLGLPLDEFGEGVVERGLGPVRVAWLDGEFLAVTDDLVVRRVNVAVETRDGVQFVIDAFVELDPEAETLEPEATIVDVFEGVHFYPACGNESLTHDGVVWYQVQESEYPEIYDRAANGYRENVPESVEIRGFAPRVVAPGPGDDVGTLVVWSDGVAYFVSDSADLDAWLVRDELTYNWVC